MNKPGGHYARGKKPDQGNTNTAWLSLLYGILKKTELIKTERADELGRGTNFKL